MKAFGTSTTSKTYNAGQVCTSLRRFNVHDSVYDQFVECFVRDLKDTKIGNGLLAQSRTASLATVRRVTAMIKMVDSAVGGNCGEV